MMIIYTEIAAFINKYAEFGQNLKPLEIKIAGNIPALDGPGSYDQPQIALLLILYILYPKTADLSIVIKLLLQK